MQRQQVQTGHRVTLGQSLTLTKNLIRTAISTVCFVRNLFPMSCFKERKLTDICINTLANDTTESKMMNQWLEEGVFAALEKKYLASIVFGICSVDEGALLECYRFQLAYPEDEEGSDHSSNSVTFDVSAHSRNGKTSKSILVPGKIEVKQQTVQMIRNLVALCSTMHRLPTERYLTLKLCYNDRADDEWEPKFFRAVTPNDVMFHVRPTMNVAVGSVATPFHHMRLQLQAAEEEYSGEVDNSQYSQRTQRPQREFYDPLRMDCEPSDSDQECVVWDRQASTSTHTPAVKAQGVSQEDSGLEDGRARHRAKPKSKRQTKQKKQKKKTDKSTNATAKQSQRAVPTRATRSTLRTQYDENNVVFADYELHQMIRDYICAPENIHVVPRLQAIKTRFNCAHVVAREAFQSLVDDGILAKNNARGYSYTSQHRNSITLNSDQCDPFAFQSMTPVAAPERKSPSPSSASPAHSEEEEEEEEEQAEMELPETRVLSDEEDTDVARTPSPPQTATLMAIQEEEEQQQQVEEEADEVEEEEEEEAQEQSSSAPASATQEHSRRQSQKTSQPSASASIWYDGVDATNIISGRRQRKPATQKEEEEEEEEEEEKVKSSSDDEDETESENEEEKKQMQAKQKKKKKAIWEGGQKQMEINDQVAAYIKDPATLDANIGIAQVARHLELSNVPYVRAAMAKLAHEGVLEDAKPGSKRVFYGYTQSWRDHVASLSGSAAVEESQASAALTPTQVLLLPDHHHNNDDDDEDDDSHTPPSLPETGEGEEEEEDLPLTQILPETLPFSEEEDEYNNNNNNNNEDLPETQPMSMGWTKRTVAPEQQPDSSPELYIPASLPFMEEPPAPAAESSKRKRKRRHGSVVTNMIHQNANYDNQMHVAKQLKTGE